MDEYTVTTRTYRDIPIVDYRSVGPMFEESFQKLFLYAVIHSVGKLIATVIPALSVLGAIVSFGAMIGYSVAIFQMAKVHSDYRSAGICYLIAHLMDVFSILPILANILCICGAYREFSTHSQILSEIDIATELDSKWIKLWIVYLIAYLGTGVFSMLTIFYPVIFMIPNVLFILLFFGVKIQQCIYLNQTRSLFSVYNAVEK